MTAVSGQPFFTFLTFSANSVLAMSTMTAFVSMTLCPLLTAIPVTLFSVAVKAMVFAMLAVFFLEFVAFFQTLLPFLEFRRVFPADFVTSFFEVTISSIIQIAPKVFEMEAAVTESLFVSDVEFFLNKDA